MNDLKKRIFNTIAIIFLLFILFLIVDTIINKSLLESSIYNSYELQARAWLKGQTFLDGNYPYLELAIYNGKYFVSFPPFPSVVLLPFILIFNNIPTNLIMFILFALEYIYIYKIIKKTNTTDLNAILLASSLTIGSSLMAISVDSGVWFIAQLLNNLLCVLAIYSFLNNRKTLVFFFLALAVGCRPFSAIFIILFIIYYMFKEKDKKISERIRDNFVALIPTIVVAIIYMTYNVIRFNNPLEFGHNYLPEFVNATNGQFSINYLWNNLKSFLWGGVHFDSKLNVTFDMPFACYIANPIIIVYLYRVVKDVIKKKINPMRVLIFGSIIINIIFICFHKTLGGWQFGARYACDFLPFVLLGIMWYKDSKNEIKKVTLDRFEIFCIIFGIILNLYGTIIYYK